MQVERVCFALLIVSLHPNKPSSRQAKQCCPHPPYLLSHRPRWRSLAIRLRNSQRLKSDIFIKASPGQPASQIHSQVLEGRNLALFWSNDGFWLSYVPILVVVFHVLNTTKILC
jgi:hypothetical protein